MKERQMRLSDEHHVQIDALSQTRKGKRYLGNAVRGAIFIAEDQERKALDLPPLSNVNQRKVFIDAYLDGVLYLLKEGYSALEAGLWVQGVISALSNVRKNS